MSVFGSVLCLVEATQQVLMIKVKFMPRRVCCIMLLVKYYLSLRNNGFHSEIHHSGSNGGVGELRGKQY